MRIVWLTSLLLITSTALAQIDTGGVDTGGLTNGAVNTGGTNTGGNNNGGGSSQIPEGFGGGGQSDNLGSAFGERTTTNETTGFIGGNANAQQGGFIGQNPAAINGQNGNNNRGGQFGNLGGAQGGGRGGQFGQPQQRQTVRRIRTRLVLPKDFASEFRNVPATKLQSNLSTQFHNIDTFQANSKLRLGSSRVFENANINVNAIGRTVTLRGQVRSERERKLAERIAKLEPGVDRVENQLTVALTP